MKRRLVQLALPACVACAVAVACTQVFTVHRGWHGWVFSAVIAICITLLWLGTMNHIDAGYSKRIAAAHAIHWQVSLNSVMLGTLTDAAYATYQQAAFRGGRSAVDQLVNLVSATCRMAWWAATSVTVIVFWGSVMGALVAPDALIAAAQQILRADATTMQVGVRELVVFGMDVCLIGVLTLAYIAVIRGTRSFGFRDCHADAVGRQLRAHFQTPAAGDVFVYPDWCEASAESALARP